MMGTSKVHSTYPQLEPGTAARRGTGEKAEGNGKKTGSPLGSGCKRGGGVWLQRSAMLHSSNKAKVNRSKHIHAVTISWKATEVPHEPYKS